jgi:hypothetical protein
MIEVIIKDKFSENKMDIFILLILKLILINIILPLSIKYLQIDIKNSIFLYTNN